VDRKGQSNTGISNLPSTVTSNVNNELMIHLTQNIFKAGILKNVLFFSQFG
jgi:hypothetical protein